MKKTAASRSQGESLLGQSDLWNVRRGSQERGRFRDPGEGRAGVDRKDLLKMHCKGA